MENKIMKYRRYSQNVKWFLAASGLWPNFHPVCKKLLSFSTFITTFVVMATVSNYCFHNVTNVMVLTKGMGIAVSFSSAFMKVCIFLLHCDDLVYLDKVLSGRYDQDLKNLDDRPVLLKNLSAFTYFMYLDAVTVVLTIFLYTIKPIIVLSKVGKYILVYPAIYPFFYEPGGLVYWILYSVEALGGWSLWTITIGVDCAFGLFALQMCGELRVLAKRFKDLRLEPGYKLKLRECIGRHHMLLNAKWRMENLFGLITIWLAISGALVLCSLIFQVAEATKSNASFLHICHLCCYLIPKSLQIFMYAWYGNLIADESRACLDSMYNSHWPDSSDICLKNDILIVLAQEPLILVAKGCMLIQLDMFTKIMKASMSYFHLLRTVNEAAS